MAFNIENFKSTIDKYGGISRNNLFEVQLSGFIDSPTDDDSLDKRDLLFFCSSVTFPGVTMNVFDYRPNNVELSQSLPYSVAHGQLECIFVVDNNHKVMEYFHRWAQRIISYSVEGVMDGHLNGTTTSNGGRQFPYEIGYKNDYAQVMSIRKYNSIGDIAYSCLLRNVYPVDIGATPLSWDNNDTYTTLPIAFSYSDFKMSGAAPLLASTQLE